MPTGRVFHFSHDPTITEFVPRDPSGLVWAVDAEHAPAYWFPRDCPRVTFWRGADHLLLAGSARVHAVEWAWLARLRDAELYRYEFDPAPFAVHDDDAGYLVTRATVRPLTVRPMPDLLDAHRAAGIELRLVENLWPLARAVPTTGLPFSLIRLRNATPPRNGTP